MTENFVAARALLEVVAGVVPEKPEPEFTKQWALTSEEWNDKDGGARLAEVTGQAQGYAMMLMLSPDRVNWVRMDWIWL